MRGRIVSGVLGLVALAAAAPPWTGEFALPGPDASFALGWVGPAGDMREYVPRSETVGRWTRMVTVQHGGWRVGITPAVWLSRWVGAMQRGCPGVVVGPIAAAPLGDHAGASVTIACPRNPASGLPEHVAARAILGDEGIQIVQAAARRPFTPADRSWATAIVDGAALCAPAAATPRCTAARSADIGSPL